MELSFDSRAQPNPRRLIGIAIVVLVHALVFYALVSGLARSALQFVKKPLEATIVEEVLPPPPPPPSPPPPRTIKQPEVPRVDATPPPYVPPPEVSPPTEAAPAVSVASDMPSPQEYRIEKPPETRPPEAAAALTLQADIGVACPTQVKPEVPPKAIQEGVAGTVRAQALISKGVVKEVRILSGPRVYHQAVRAAMLKYVCIASSDMLVQQEFDFRVE